MMLRLEAIAFDTIEDVAAKMVDLNRMLDIPIGVEFNGVEITANGWAAASIVAGYYRQLSEMASRIREESAHADT